MAAANGISSAVVSNGNALPPESVIFGQSAAMSALRRKLERLPGMHVPVLIQGENGTGKEIIARYIHNNSASRTGAFVKVNCPAIPGQLFESEVFGYEKGAFTGAWNHKPGRVEAAEGGTLFWDEIGELSSAQQASLLQFLQDGRFSRVGARDESEVSVQVICATNRDLEESIATGEFRQDLFYRINVISIHLPALRERREDIAILVDYFLEYHRQKFNAPKRKISEHLLRLMHEYRWPGNIRELENFIKRYIIMGSEAALCSELLSHFEDPLDLDAPLSKSMPLKTVTRQAVRTLERKMILQALDANNWNRKKAALALDISYRGMLAKLKSMGLCSPRVSQG